MSGETKDTSSGSIIASALYELSSFSEENKEKHFSINGKNKGFYWNIQLIQNQVDWE